jgi:hypothetical protein
VLASSGDRTLALVVGFGGAVEYDWWDLGGGSNGFRFIESDELFTDAPAGGGLVRSGNYAFTVARKSDNTVYLNQGIPGGKWADRWQLLSVKSKVAPSAASTGDRTMAIITRTDGHMMYDWWDYGGAGHGFSEIPGGLLSNHSTAAALVDNGNYAFVLAMSYGMVWVNQGAPGGSWVGWRSMGISSNLPPAATSCGARTLVVVVTPTGQIMYDWWDLGGGGHGFREIPGSFRTPSTVGVALVGNGKYAFVMARDSTSKLWLNQGDPTTGSWVGWR